MALLYKIGSVTVTGSFNSWVAGDVIEVFFDYDQRNGTFPAMYEVQKNGSTITSPQDSMWPPAIFEGFALFYRYITNENVEFVSDDAALVYYFEHQNEFPYFEKKSRENVSGGVNDLEGFATTTTQATDANSGDGVVTVYAKGTNNPFTAQLNGVTKAVSTAVSGYQYGYWDYTTTFTGLYPGDYPITFTDTLGYTRETDVTVQTLTDSGQEGYGELYDFIFQDNNGQQYKVEILERGRASGSPTTLTKMGANPFTLSTSAISTELHEIILLKTTATLELVSETFRQFKFFATADDEKYKVKFYREDSGYQLKWEGFISPQDYEEDFFQPPVITKLVAHDRLGRLSEYRFEREVEQEDLLSQKKAEPVTGVLSQLTIIDFCLKKLNQNQGYRIACHLFEDDQATSNTTPLDQTFVDTSCYYKGDEGMNCEEVVKNILEPYGAVLLNWEGYWYIVRKEEMEAATVNYIQYDSSLTQDGTGSYTPRVSFKSAGSSDMYRWKGSQSLTYEPIYRNINLKLAYNLKGKGLLTDGFDGWSRGAVSGFATSGLGPDGWTLGSANSDSDTKIVKTGLLEGTESDSFKLKYTAKCWVFKPLKDDPEQQLKGPYFPLKWSLKVGTKYVDTSGVWRTTAVENQFLMDQLGNAETIEYEFPLYGASNSEYSYELTLYAGSIYESDLQNASASGLITDIEALTTTSLNLGARLIGRVGTVDNGDKDFHYYELRYDTDTGSSDIKNIKPTDHHASTNSKRWERVGQWSYDYGAYSTDSLYGAYTKTLITAPEFSILPNGQEPPKEEVFTYVANKNNKVDLDIDLFHFDLSGVIHSDQFIYNNFLRLADGSETNAWEYNSGGEAKIQEHLGKYLAKKYGVARQRISGNFYSDAEITPLSVLYDTGDDNRVMMLSSIDMNYKEMDFQGECVEISSDDTPEYFDFDQDDFKPADFK
ncbi:MAG: hypothetical protein ACRBG0_19325 [Lewinella sp.]|uniref:hypothetical protein n=1 Tax=Lewinella sp. TaxID=2004506 RepID=UPI003D6C3D10